MALKGKCENHGEMMQEIGSLQAARIFLEKKDTETAKEVKKLDLRVADIEKMLSKFFGIVTGLTAVFVLIKVVEVVFFFMPSARTAIGG